MSASAPQSTQHPFIQLVDQHMSQIVSDSYERMRKVKNPDKNSSRDFLNTGIWYANDYYHALQKFNQQGRVKWLVDQGITYHGRIASSTAFQPVSDSRMPTGKKICEFVLKKSVLPSEGLDSLSSSFNILDCSSTLMLAAAYAVRDYLGPEKFNALFASEGPYPLVIGPIFSNPISLLYNQMQITEENDLVEGDLCCFSNIQPYVRKHQAGNARSQWVCYRNRENKNFLGFGLHPEGVVSEKIVNKLWKSFNADPEAKSIYTQKTWDFLFQNYFLKNIEQSKTYCETLKDAKVTRLEFDSLPSRNPSANGKLDLDICRPNLELIDQLAQASISEAQSLFGPMKL